MRESGAGTRRVALKIDVDTLRGTREGVPALVRALRSHGADATFYFSVGPDHTGRALRRAFRPGFARKVVRTSVLKHYGLKTLMYGVLLPGPDIGAKAGDDMRAVRAAGFEVGLHTFDHVRWQDHVARADAQWTQREFERGLEAFERVFGAAPESHAAAGWQMNERAFELEQVKGLSYASDTRGRAPFFPRLANGSRGCLQLPTTLPTFDELLGRAGVHEHNIEQAVLREFDRAAPGDHVFTLHAELEGMQLLPSFKRLMQGWRERGVPLVRMAALRDALDLAQVPLQPVEYAEVPGRSGILAVQGNAA